MDRIVRHVTNITYKSLDHKYKNKNATYVMSGFSRCRVTLTLDISLLDRKEFQMILEATVKYFVLDTYSFHKGDAWESKLSNRKIPSDKTIYPDDLIKKMIGDVNLMFDHPTIQLTVDEYNSAFESITRHNISLAAYAKLYFTEDPPKVPMNYSEELGRLRFLHDEMRIFNHDLSSDKAIEDILKNHSELNKLCSNMLGIDLGQYCEKWIEKNQKKQVKQLPSVQPVDSLESSSIEKLTKQIEELNAALGEKDEVIKYIGEKWKEDNEKITDLERSLSENLKKIIEMEHLLERKDNEYKQVSPPETVLSTRKSKNKADKILKKSRTKKKKEIPMSKLTGDKESTKKTHKKESPIEESKEMDVDSKKRNRENHVSEIIELYMGDNFRPNKAMSKLVISPIDHLDVGTIQYQTLFRLLAFIGGGGLLSQDKTISNKITEKHAAAFRMVVEEDPSRIQGKFGRTMYDKSHQYLDPNNDIPIRISENIEHDIFKSDCSKYVFWFKATKDGLFKTRKFDSKQDRLLFLTAIYARHAMLNKSTLSSDLVRFNGLWDYSKSFIGCGSIVPKRVYIVTNADKKHKIYIFIIQVFTFLHDLDINSVRGVTFGCDPKYIDSFIHDMEDIDLFQKIEYPSSEYQFENITYDNYKEFIGTPLIQRISFAKSGSFESKDKFEDEFLRIILKMHTYIDYEIELDNQELLKKEAEKHKNEDEKIDEYNNKRWEEIEEILKKYKDELEKKELKINKEITFLPNDKNKDKKFVLGQLLRGSMMKGKPNRGFYNKFMRVYQFLQLTWFNRDLCRTNFLEFITNDTNEPFDTEAIDKILEFIMFPRGEGEVQEILVIYEHFQLLGGKSYNKELVSLFENGALHYKELFEHEYVRYLCSVYYGFRKHIEGTEYDIDEKVSGNIEYDNVPINQVKRKTQEFVDYEPFGIVNLNGINSIKVKNSKTRPITYNITSNTLKNVYIDGNCILTGQSMQYIQYMNVKNIHPAVCYKMLMNSKSDFKSLEKLILETQRISETIPKSLKFGLFKNLKFLSVSDVPSEFMDFVGVDQLNIKIHVYEDDDGTILGKVMDKKYNVGLCLHCPLDGLDRLKTENVTILKSYV